MQMEQEMNTMKAMMESMRTFIEQMQGPKNKTDKPDTGETKQRNRVVLEEKYFRRVEKFDGEPTKFRGWIFNLLVSIGQVDEQLGKELKLVFSKGHDENWDPELDVELKRTYTIHIHQNSSE